MYGSRLALDCSLLLLKSECGDHRHSYCTCHIHGFPTASILGTRVLAGPEVGEQLFQLGKTRPCLIKRKLYFSILQEQVDRGLRSAVQPRMVPSRACIPALGVVWKGSS